MILYDVEELILKYYISFFHKNIPKDAKKYNKLLNNENKYDKEYDFTDKINEMYQVF
jgi:hypothetical protein